MEVRKGVVQGSILGSNLYSIYTSDLNKLISFGSLYMYADEKIVHTALTRESVDCAVGLLNCYLDTLSQWPHVNYLDLNDGKYSYIVLGTRKILK